MCKVGFIIDFAAVGFGDEGANEVPGDFEGGDVGSAFGDCFDPGIDDVGCAFVLEGFSCMDRQKKRKICLHRYH